MQRAVVYQRRRPERSVAQQWCRRIWGRGWRGGARIGVVQAQIGGCYDTAVVEPPT